MGAGLQSRARRLFIPAVMVWLWAACFAQANVRTASIAQIRREEMPLASARLEDGNPCWQGVSFESQARLGLELRIGILCGGDPVNFGDPDGRLDKGFYAGSTDAPIPGDASSAYMAGYYAGGIRSAYYQGAYEGAAIEANTFTFGQIGSLDSYANSLQGGVYDFTRGASYTALGALTLAGGGALWGTPAVYNAGVAVGFSPWTPVAVASLSGGYLAYQQGGSAGDIAASTIISGGFQYTQNPFPVFGGNNSSSTVNLTPDSSEEPSVPAGMMPLPQQQQQVQARSPTVLTLDGDKYPIDAASLEEANAVGVPLPVNRDAADANRDAALSGLPKIPGFDLGESPPAIFRNPGDPVIVRPTPPGQNRGAGASLGNQARPVPNGGQVIIVIKRGTE